MILDSTFLVDVLRGSEDVGDRLAAIDETAIPLVSTISVMELSEGVRLSDVSAAEAAAVDALLADVEELPFTRECAERAGAITASLIEAGAPIDETDAMIGATALVHDVPVVTRNVSHFERIEGLEIVSY